MALNVSEVIENERMADKGKRERAQRAAEWYIEHKFARHEKAVTYLEAALRFQVSEWLVKDAVRTIKTEVRIREEQEREGSPD